MGVRGLRRRWVLVLAGLLDHGGHVNPSTPDVRNRRLAQHALAALVKQCESADGHSTTVHIPGFDAVVIINAEHIRGTGAHRAWKYLYFLKLGGQPRMGGYDRRDSFVAWAFEKINTTYPLATAVDEAPEKSGGESQRNGSGSLCRRCGYLRDLHSIEPPYDMNAPHGFYCEGFEVASAEPATPAGDPGISTPVGMPGNSVSRSHGVQGDLATAASCTTLALETAAGIQLEELAEVCGEGETDWNAQRRNDIARKMQRIAANCPNRYSEDELVSTVARAERGELRS